MLVIMALVTTVLTCPAFDWLWGRAWIGKSRSQRSTCYLRS